MIPNAHHVETPGDPNFPGTDNGQVADEVETFLTGTRQLTAPKRILATVVFTDIVDSTGRAAQLGDTGWVSLLERHDALARHYAEQFGGSIVKATGDGLLVTFDGPSRAVRFALALRDAAHTLDLELRAGIHTGEIETR